MSNDRKALMLIEIATGARGGSGGGGSHVCTAGMPSRAPNPPK
jgi:hypothetical protein